jgi:hypothetical protein
VSEKADGAGERAEEALDTSKGDDPRAESSNVTEDDPGAPSDSAASAQEEGAKAAPGWYQNPNSPDQQRYWDGKAWSDQIMPAGVAVSTVRRSPDERKAMLAQQVQQAVGRGLRIESQSDYQAVLVQGKPVNHTLHAILTIFTCLLWGIVWAVIAGTGGEKREMIVVDEFGNVQHQKLGKV